MLTLDAVTFRQGGFALSADWTLPARSRLTLLGPSGAGKSTLLLGLAGFLEPERGRVLWEGADLTGVPPGQRPAAMVFQDSNLFPHLSIARNVALGISPARRLAREDQDRVDAALERVGLGACADRKPGHLSGGQQSRAALARVLVMARPLLLLDEPFAALGPALRAEMLDLVTGLCDDTGATLIMVSHAPDDARRIGGVTSVVADGVASAPVETEALLANPPDVLRDYLG